MLMSDNHKCLWDGKKVCEAKSKIAGKREKLSEEDLKAFLEECKASIPRVRDRLIGCIQHNSFDSCVAVNFTKVKSINDLNLAMSDYDEYSKFCSNHDAMLSPS